MADLNEVRLIGRLTRDPELKSTASGMQVATFGLATSKKYKGQDGVLREDTTRKRNANKNKHLQRPRRQRRGIILTNTTSRLFRQRFLLILAIYHNENCQDEVSL